MSGAKAKRNLFPDGYYHRLLATPLPSRVEFGIEKDLDRTFPGHPLLESERGQAALRRILHATSVHNPDSGYCQGMNFIAGVLSFVLDEEEAFWVFDIILNELLPEGFFGCVFDFTTESSL